MELMTGVASTLIVQAPIIAVLVIGVVLSLAQGQRYPKAARLTLIACSIWLVELLIGSFLSIWLPLNLMASGQSSSQIGLVFGAVGFVRGLIIAAALGLLLTAVFRTRNEQNTLMQEA